MPLIHLIRHGETDGNGTHYIGRSDRPLNATGQAQAMALAADPALGQVTGLWSSPLQRARQTAAPLAQRLGLPVIPCAALAEIDFGTLQDLPKRDRGLNLRKSHAWTPLPGGESLHDVWQRLLPLAAHLRTAPDGDRIALFGHYWTNRMLNGLLCDLSFDETLDLRDYKPANGNCTTIRMG